MEVGEVREKIEEAGLETGGRRVALVIAVLAAFLAISELGARGSQNRFSALNAETNNLWSFFQSKTIRAGANRDSADIIEAMITPDMAPDRRAALTAQAGKLRAEAARMDSEPATGEGRRELTERAKATAAQRDTSLAAYEAFEWASAGLQLAVVLASAGLLTRARWLVGTAIAIGVACIALNLIGWFAPGVMEHL